MLAILHALGIFACDLLKSRRRLQAENLFLRHQLNIALRRAPVCTEKLIRQFWLVKFPVIAFEWSAPLEMGRRPLRY
jgi:hypothetical protein